MKDNFRFWFPGEFVKGVDPKDPSKKKKKMFFQGFASSNRKDLDGENLAQKGLDISYLNERGIINWNHSKDPLCVIGEPAETVFKDGKLWVKSELYEDQKMAQKVYYLGEVLKNNSNKRKLGYSIEGKVIERDPFNKNKVLKALVTNVAITINPKNADSYIDIVKGEFNGFNEGENHENYEDIDIYIDNEIKKALHDKLIEDDEEEVNKSCTTDSAEPIIPESVDGVKPKGENSKKDEEDEEEEEEKDDENEESKIKYLNKSQTVDKIISTNSGITVRKAEKIFNELNKLLIMSQENKTVVTDDLLQKAMNSIGISNANEDDEEETENVEKGIENENVSVENENKSFVTQEQFSEFQKSINSGFENLTQLIRNGAIISKGGYDMAKSVNDELVELNEKFNSFSNQVPARKAVINNIAPVDRNFSKGVQDDINNQQTGKRTIGLRTNKRIILDTLDKIAFNKGVYNEQAATAMTTFECSNYLSDEFIKSVEDELNVKIVNQ